MNVLAWIVFASLWLTAASIVVCVLGAVGKLRNKKLLWLAGSVCALPPITALLAVTLYLQGFKP